MTEELVIPRVHMNGTSRQELLAQISKALGALAEADRALAEMTPNDRDYYVIDAGAGRQAREQHVKRRQALAGISTEILTIGERIADQTDNRNRLSGARS